MSMNFVQCGPNMYEDAGSGVIVCTRPDQSPEEAWAEAQQTASPSYRDLRYAEYAPLRDQIDAIAKGMIALRDQGIYLPTDTLAWLAKVEAVKVQYPKDDE